MIEELHLIKMDSVFVKRLTRNPTARKLDGFLNTSDPMNASDISESCLAAVSGKSKCLRVSAC